MPDASDVPDEIDERTALAVERTLLAWLRTGIAIMGLGFVVARFSLFLREVAVLRDPWVRTPRLSVWIGTGLMLLGVGVHMAVAWRYAHNIRRLRSVGIPTALGGYAGATVASTLALLGLAMVVYLVLLAAP